MSVINPATFLELTQRLHAECQIAGTAPTDIVNSVGTNLQLFYWINESWRWLQGLNPDWQFMHVKTLSFQTVAGQMQYSPTDAGVAEGAVSSWCKDRFRQYLTSGGQAGEIPMTYWDYDDFYDTYLRSTNRTAQRPPVAISVDPSLNLMIECPLPGYTITGEYYRGVVGMEAESDIPLGLPVEDRMILVWKGLQLYGNNNNAPELLATANVELKRLKNRLELRYLPKCRAN